MSEPTGQPAAEPGWYRIEGDPPGTMRRWNGAQWIGVPTRMEGAPVATGGDAAPVPDRDMPVGRLGAPGVIAAAICVIGFVAMAALMLTLILSLQANYDAVGSNYFNTRRIRNLGDLVPNLGITLWALGALVVLTTVSFNAWVTNAALASNAITGSKIRRAKNHRPDISIWFLFVFGWFLTLLVYIFGGSKGASARPSMFELVNRTAAACKLGPMKVFVWWALLWIPALVGAGTLSWLFVSGRDSAGSMQTAIRIGQVVMAAEVISLATIIGTILLITSKLRR